MIRYKEINAKEAERLADLYSIYFDFLAVIDYCNDYRKKMVDIARNAFCLAAVVTYCRPFGSGVREKLPKEILLEVNDEQRNDHEWFINLRDKYYAHSVSQIEHYAARLHYDDLDPENQDKWSVAWGGINCMVALGQDDMERLGKLAEALLNIVQAYATREEKAILALVKSRGLEAVTVEPKRIDLNVRERAARPRPRSRSKKPRGL